MDIGGGFVEAKVRASHEFKMRFLRRILWISYIDVIMEDRMCLKHD